MRILKKWLVAGVPVILAVGLVACDKKNDAEHIDSTSNNNQVERAADRVENKVDEAAHKLDHKMDQAGETLDDAGITAKIKAAILAEPGLKSLQISVDTIQNVVTLTGSVDSQHNSDRAKEIAGAVAGVKAVENKLVVK